MFDLWAPPKPALILPHERAAIIRPAAPKNSPPSTLGLTMMARTWAMRQKRQGSAAPTGISVVGAFENTSNGSGTTTVTLSGTASGYVCYAFQTNAADAAYPSGYTSLGSIRVRHYTSQFNDMYLNISRKVLTGADTSTVFPANGNSGNVGTACGVYVLSGVNTTTPEDASMTSIADQTVWPPDSPSITTVTNGALVISVFGAYTGGDSALTEPSGYGNKIDVGSDPASLGIASLIIATAGATNPGAWSNVDDDGYWAAATVAVRPA